MPDDYVKRSDVHRAFQPKYAPAINRTFAAMIDSVPAADVVEVRHGKWINAYPEIEPNPMFMYGICSVCGFEQSVSDKLKYCPNCGAKMDGGQDDV